MTIEEIVKLLPQNFILVGHEFKVIVEEFLYNAQGNSCYGLFTDGENTIRIAQKLDMGNNRCVVLSKEQILNTFEHELCHAFLFMSGMEQDEVLCQNFANFRREFESTKQ